MKKKILIVLASLITVAFVACKSDTTEAKFIRPDGMPEETFEKGLDAFDVIVDFYDGDITSIDAVNELNDIARDLTACEFESDSDEEVMNKLVTYDILLCAGELLTDEDVSIERFGDLSEHLGYQYKDE